MLKAITNETYRKFAIVKMAVFSQHIIFSLSLVGSNGTNLKFET